MQLDFLKSQLLNLEEWLKRLVKYFNGDPNLHKISSDVSNFVSETFPPQVTHAPFHLQHFTPVNTFSQPS